MENGGLLSLMLTNRHAIWITWERQRRSLVLAEQFNAKLFVYDDAFSNCLLRYIILLLRTFKLIVKEKPKYVFCQNPSLFLTYMLCLIKNTFNFVLIVDRHSNFRFENKEGIVDIIFKYISNYTIKRANNTIVTNNYLCDFVNKIGGRGAVLQDKLPELTLGVVTSMKGKTNVVFISSFSSDEPIDEVIHSFEGLEDQYLYITGNYKKSTKYSKLANKLPQNIIFTGFLEEREYQSLLVSADIVMVLTTQEHTLTCGAYEGVALGKPLIVSNTNAMRDYFGAGVEYTDPDRAAIKKSLTKCIDKIELCENNIKMLRSELDENWRIRFTELCKLIYNH